MKFTWKIIFFLIGLIGFSYQSLAIAQTTHILRVPPSGFLETSNLQTYYRSNFVLSTSGSGFFYFPITLPNNSIIKEIEINAYDNDNDGKIKLSLVSAKGASEQTLGFIETLNDNELQIIKSAKINHQIDYSQYSYSLILSFSAHTTPLNFYSAVIYYQPPTSLSYLPQVAN